MSDTKDPYSSHYTSNAGKFQRGPDNGLPKPDESLKDTMVGTQTTDTHSMNGDGANTKPGPQAAPVTTEVVDEAKEAAKAMSSGLGIKKIAQQAVKGELFKDSIKLPAGTHADAVKAAREAAEAAYNEMHFGKRLVARTAGAFGQSNLIMKGLRGGTAVLGVYSTATGAKNLLQGMGVMSPDKDPNTGKDMPTDGKFLKGVGLTAAGLGAVALSLKGGHRMAFSRN